MNKKKVITMISVLSFFTVPVFAFGIFAPDYVKIKPDESVKQVLSTLSDVTGYDYVLKNNTTLKIPSPYNKKDYKKIYDLNTLNKYLIRHKSKYLLKTVKIKNRTFFLKIVPVDYYDDYYVKGVRLENETLKDVINKLNKEHYQKTVYNGKDFKIPDDPSLIVKDIQQLKKYLDASSYKTIEIKKVEDINKDGIADIIEIKEKDNATPSNFTAMQSLIYYLKKSIEASKKVKNPNFAKQTYQKNIQSIIEDLENL